MDGGRRQGASEREPAAPAMPLQWVCAVLHAPPQHALPGIHKRPRQAWHVCVGVCVCVCSWWWWGWCVSVRVCLGGGGVAGPGMPHRERSQGAVARVRQRGVALKTPHQPL